MAKKNLEKLSFNSKFNNKTNNVSDKPVHNDDNVIDKVNTNTLDNPNLNLNNFSNPENIKKTITLIIDKDTDEWIRNFTWQQKSTNGYQTIADTLNDMVNLMKTKYPNVKDRPEGLKRKEKAIGKRIADGKKKPNDFNKILE